MANSSALLKTVTGPAHTVTNTWEAGRNVLDRKENKVGTAVISSYDYTVNPSGQRTDVAQAGSAFAAARGIVWGYDSLGQLTSADSTIPGLDRAYQYDSIGNRLKTADDLTLPPTDNYTPNALNQYTSVPSVASVLSYDPDGNMTSGPLPANLSANSTLGWDAENRLVSASVPGGDTVTFFYDAQSRRIAETVGTATTLYLYDGWNCIAEYSITGTAAPVLAKTRTWGLDLSGTLQGAGGVGGLLCESQISNSQIASYYPTYDGNGNVSEYLAADGSTAAHFEYDPFGNAVVNSDVAGMFPYRFSTKPLDAATGLYYYGYRYYDPVTGRWPSRDPIEERGGINLYGFVGNDGVNQWDLLGLFIEVNAQSVQTLSYTTMLFILVSSRGDDTEITSVTPSFSGPNPKYRDNGRIDTKTKKPIFDKEDGITRELRIEANQITVTIKGKYKGCIFEYEIQFGDQIAQWTKAKYCKDWPVLNFDSTVHSGDTKRFDNTFQIPLDESSPEVTEINCDGTPK
jgi:RHS repeat-associated protein